MPEAFLSYIYGSLKQRASFINCVQNTKCEAQWFLRFQCFTPSNAREYYHDMKQKSCLQPMQVLYRNNRSERGLNWLREFVVERDLSDAKRKPKVRAKSTRSSHSTPHFQVVEASYHLSTGPKYDTHSLGKSLDVSHPRYRYPESCIASHDPTYSSAERLGHRPVLEKTGQ